VQAFLLQPRLVHSSVTNIKVIPDMYELTTSSCLKYNIAHDVWDCRLLYRMDDHTAATNVHVTPYDSRYIFYEDIMFSAPKASAEYL
ncbi:hypothetical protein K439DRAFT_1633351, partial [Ramaria rubella]